MPTQYWLLATADELARLLCGEIADAIRAQAIDLLHREPFEKTDVYLARLVDLEKGGAE